MCAWIGAELQGEQHIHRRFLHSRMRVLMHHSAVRLYDDNMQFHALRHRFLLALGLPLVGASCVTVGAPPSDGTANLQAHTSASTNSAGNAANAGTSPGFAPPHATEEVVPPLSVNQRVSASVETSPPVQTSVAPFPACGIDQVREQLCGQGSHPNPEVCPPTGEHLTAFGRNVIVSGINIHARDGSLRSFGLDSAATSAYQRELQGSIPSQFLSHYCCYSHCQNLTVAASAQKQIPIGMTEGSYCIPIPEGGTKFPAPHAQKCPAALQVEGVMRPYSTASYKGQCCYSVPVPAMPPHPRGRAARIDGIPHVAAVVSASAWRSGQTKPQVEHLDSELRSRLAARWLHDAQLEHASIAAFARTSLELLAFGAPPELLTEAHQAALDEITHARVTFALASTYAGQELGPQAFSDVMRMAPAADWATWARETIEDGCVGETIAAAEAYEAAQHTEDPVVRDILLGISEDETRHAELAFKILRFALLQGGAEVESVAQSALTTLLARTQSPSTDRNVDLSVHGILGAQQSAELRADVINSVVIPCLEGLLRTQSKTDDVRRLS